MTRLHGGGGALKVITHSVDVKHQCLFKAGIFFLYQTELSSVFIELTFKSNLTGLSAAGREDK